MTHSNPTYAWEPPKPCKNFTTKEIHDPKRMSLATRGGKLGSDDTKLVVLSPEIALMFW